jgi:hypothetical protein
MFNAPAVHLADKDHYRVYVFNLSDCQYRRECPTEFAGRPFGAVLAGSAGLPVTPAYV